MDNSEAHRCWRLLIDPPYEGPRNMSIDEALLERCASKENSSAFPVIRFYRWLRPTLSLGYNQDIEDSIHTQVCKEKGIAIVRRPTGGKAVLHDQELTYSITAPFSSPPFQKSVFDNYRMISEALLEGLRLLGIEAVIADEEAPAYSLTGSEACFARLSKFEISCRGFKMVGSAQRRKRKAFLQHGSILLDADRQLIRSLIRSKESQNEMDFITVRESLGRVTHFKEIASSVAKGFEKKFEVKLQKSALTKEERDLSELFTGKRSLMQKFFL